MKLNLYKSNPVLASLRRLAILLGLYVLIPALIAPVLAQPKEFRLGQVSQWVVPVSDRGQLEPAAAPVGQSVDYLLSDEQVRLESHGRSVYRRVMLRVLNDKGLDEAANINIDFDPAYQSLTLHAINVLRGGQVINKLDAAAVRVLQREKELEYLVYDGSKTASIFLHDIRAGDIVDYAYTLTGTNPVFGNKAFGRLDLQWNVPVRHLSARLLVPSDRDIDIVVRNAASAHAVRELPGYREHRWDSYKLPALTVDRDAPGWFDPYPSAQWTEFKDWAAVVRWALPLYRLPAPLSPQLQAEVDKIAREHADVSGRMLAVLRFVQTEIRYLGVEVGQGSHAPTSPLVVLERRFGDCKDKTLLTITMLDALGIKARPALVNTQAKRGIHDWQPTPGAFNHVLVAVRAQDGSNYWLDPTRAPQTGNLASIFQPDFGLALLVEEGSQALVAMQPLGGVRQQRLIRAHFNVRGGLGKPVYFTISTQVMGAAAESTRNMLASQSREELQKRYLNYYASYYPGIQVMAPITVQDDEAANLLTVTEQYMISAFWTQTATGHDGAIYAPDLLEYLHKPDSLIRNAPLSRSFPLELLQITEVDLPNHWNIKPEHTVINDPAFTFSRDLVNEGSRLTFTDRFRSLSDHIAAGDMARYSANLELANDATNFSLSIPKAGAVFKVKRGKGMARFNWAVAMLGLMLLGVWIRLAIKLYRYDPIPAVLAPPAQAIGGWLILPALTVLTLPLRFFSQFAETVPSYMADRWVNLTSYGAEAYHPLWAPALLFQLAGNLALLVFSILAALLFFQKRRSLPYMYVGLLLGAFLFAVVNITFAGAIPAAAATDKDWLRLLPSLVGLLVWGRYFHVSQRVKATFVNRAGRASV